MTKKLAEEGRPKAMRTGLIKGLSIAQSLAQPSSVGWRRGGSAAYANNRLSK